MDDGASTEDLTQLKYLAQRAEEIGELTNTTPWSPLLRGNQRVAEHGPTKREADWRLHGIQLKAASHPAEDGRKSD